MAINLKKGQKIDLTKTNPGLEKILIGLGWDTNKYDGQSSFDLDASVFLLDENGKCSSEQNFIFYGNTKNTNNSVVHSGDNRTGDGDGDDEVIEVNLSQIPQDVKEVVFAITIYDAETRDQNFGQVNNSFVRVVDDKNGEELIRYDLGEDFSIETALVVSKLYRHGSEWKFAAIGSGYEGGLGSLVTDFGLDVN